MQFMHPLWLLLLLLFPLPWIFLRRRGHVGFSDTRLVQEARFSRILIWAPLALFQLALACVIIAWARPQVPRPSAAGVIQSRDIIMAVDISASMDAGFEGKIPPPEKSDPELDKALPPIPKKAPERDRYGYSRRYYDDDTSSKRANRRIDAAQDAVMRFTRHRFLRAQGDRAAVISFDTAPHWRYPLTDDLKQIYRQAMFISEGMGGGTNFGEVDPGPIDWAYDHFIERGRASARVIILVTDGEDHIGRSAMSRLQSKLTELNIKLYVIGVGPTLGGRTDLGDLAETTGGKVYRVENAAGLTQCFDSIDELERSPIEIERPGGYRDIFPAFAIMALVFLLSAVAVDAFIIRQ